MRPRLDVLQAALEDNILSMPLHMCLHMFAIFECELNFEHLPGRIQLKYRDAAGMIEL